MTTGIDPDPDLGLVDHLAAWLFPSLYPDGPVTPPGRRRAGTGGQNHELP